MYMNFDGVLINSSYFAKIIKTDKDRLGNVVGPCLRYELINGEMKYKLFDSESDRDNSYEDIKNAQDEGGSGGGTFDLSFSIVDDSDLYATKNNTQYTFAMDKSDGSLYVQG